MAYSQGYLQFVVVNFSLPERDKRHPVSPHHTGNAWAIDRDTAKATTWGSLAKQSFSCSTWPRPFISPKSRMLQTEAPH